MKKMIIEAAYAKINYLLHVGAKRDDGFHDILSLMQTISLCDEVKVSSECGEGISLTVIGNDAVPTGRQNLVWRAAELFMSTIGVKRKINICLTKRIPMAGGLAGGSADAAATLRALNRLFDDRLEQKELFSLAEQLGSDISFCVAGGLALCTGRGEILSPIALSSGNHHFLVINRGEYVSTAQAYAMVDTRLSIPTTPDWRPCIEALNNRRDDIGLTMTNTFEPYILPLCPLATEAKAALSEHGAIAAMMSGSGSTVYGIFDSRDAALAAQKQLPFDSMYATDVFENTFEVVYE